MPPKLSKRQQRELEELESLKAHETYESSEEEYLRPSIPQHAKGSTFAQLMTPEEPEESEPESDHPLAEPATKSGSKARKPKKRKKKTAATVEPPSAFHGPNDSGLTKNADTSTVTANSTPTTKSEKNMKKAKGKQKASGVDELDQALAELAVRYSEAPNTNMSSADSQSFAKLLSVSLSHLDSEAELRKFFGSKVVQTTKAASGSSSSSSVGRRQRQLPSGALRSHLTKPKPTWWAASQREGLSILACTDEEVKDKLKKHSWDAVGGEEKWWTVEYSKKYKSMTKAFMRTVMSGDPQGFWDLLGKLPWHADTLLQVAEVYRHREEWPQAVDFVDRALFTYERSFIGAFSFTTGRNRLDFDRVENRPFFLAIHRQITDLQRRGCVRTAFEFARLLYSLDPWSDPHGALYHLDFLALKAQGMNQWLLDVYDIFSSRRQSRPKGKRDTRSDPSVLPGWAYSRALAMWMIEDARKDKEHNASSEALKEAVLSFPSVVPLLADKIDASIPNAIRSHREFKVEVDGIHMSLSNAMLHMLSHLYAQHAFGVWKVPPHREWFTTVITSLSSSLPSTLPVTPHREDFLRLYEQSPNLRYSAYRHVLVLESSYRRLFSFIPKVVMESRSLACDPLPPPSAVSRYDGAFFDGIEDAFLLGTSGNRTRRQREADQRRLEQLVRDNALLRQVQEMFDADPQIAARFPGGVLQFAQLIDQMPDEAVGDLVLQLQGVGEGGEGEGRMPGNYDHVQVNNEHAMHHGVVDETREEAEPEGHDDESETEEEPTTLIQGFRNVFARFWGGHVEDEGSTSEESEGAMEDTVD